MTSSNKYSKQFFTLLYSKLWSLHKLQEPAQPNHASYPAKSRPELHQKLSALKTSCPPCHSGLACRIFSLHISALFDSPFALAVTFAIKMFSFLLSFLLSFHTISNTFITLLRFKKDELHCKSSSCPRLHWALVWFSRRFSLYHPDSFLCNVPLSLTTTCVLFFSSWKSFQESAGVCGATWENIFGLADCLHPLKPFPEGCQ